MEELLNIANGNKELAEEIGLKSIFIKDEYSLNLNKEEFRIFLNNNYSIILKKIISGILTDYDDISVYDPFKTTSLITKLHGKFHLKNPTKLYESRFLINDIDFTTELKERYDVVISDLTSSEEDIGQIFNKFLKYANSLIIINVDSDLAVELLSNHYLKALISLPIYESNNSSILIFDLNNKSDEYIIIDESRFLNGFKDVKDWTFLSNELVDKIVPVYSEFKKSDNSIIVKKDIKTKRNVKKRVGSSNLNQNTHNFNSVSEKDYKSIMKNKYVVNENKTINNQMYDKNMPQIENMLSKKGRNVIDDEVKFFKLNQLANLKLYEKNPEKDSLLMSTCGQSFTKPVFYSKEVIEDCRDFIEIDVISDKVLKEYIYAYLNSNKGLAEIDYFSNGNLFITPENMEGIRIPVPSINSQKEIVKAVNESNEFFKSIKILRNEFQDNILDYKHIMNSINEFRGIIEIDNETGEIIRMNKNWRHVYDKLIWPLAITYLSATKGGFEKTDKASKYLILFEFVAAFNSIILLSALPDDVYQKFKRTSIWNAEYLSMYDNMTFGNWIYIYRNLAEIYRNNDFSTGFDKKLFDELSDEKIIKMLDKTRFIRNKHVHGSMITHKEAEFLLEELHSYLIDVFEILEVYSNYKLIYTTGIFKKFGNNFNHRVILLNGACKQPIYGNINFNKVLEENSLYLYNSSNDNLLLIDDKLIKFQSVDNFEKQWGLYVFAGSFINKRGQCLAKYKFFQENEKDYFEEINSFEEDIIR